MGSTCWGDVSKLWGKIDTSGVGEATTPIDSRGAQTGLAQRQTASAWLGSVAELGLLDEAKVGREKIFINRLAMEALTGDSEV
ncbi:hypothetical protein [Corynebacterium sp. 22KM0430]|uniref:hypothetical protein n=1 Tax=unclassified Corynebacterium TaxID=2624378 RepID=UPI0039AF2807